MIQDPRQGIPTSRASQQPDLRSRQLPGPRLQPQALPAEPSRTLHGNSERLALGPALSHTQGARLQKCALPLLGRERFAMLDTVLELLGRGHEIPPALAGPNPLLADARQVVDQFVEGMLAQLFCWKLWLLESEDA